MGKVIDFAEARLKLAGAKVATEAEAKEAAAAESFHLSCPTCKGVKFNISIDGVEVSCADCETIIESTAMNNITFANKHFAEFLIRKSDSDLGVFFEQMRIMKDIAVHCSLGQSVWIPGLEISLYSVIYSLESNNVHPKDVIVHLFNKRVPSQVFDNLMASRNYYNVWPKTNDDFTMPTRAGTSGDAVMVMLLKGANCVQNVKMTMIKDMAASEEIFE